MTRRLEAASEPYHVGSNDAWPIAHGEFLRDLDSAKVPGESKVRIFRVHAFEEHEFEIETSTGRRKIVMSKSALSRIAGNFTADAETVVRLNGDVLLEIVERKIGKGRSDEGQIRIHGTDI